MNGSTSYVVVDPSRSAKMSLATRNSNALDLHASLKNPIPVPPLGRALIPTNVSPRFRPGQYALILPRSGWALKHGLTVLNAPGLIDEDYEGEIGVILYNSNPAQEILIEDGDKIAQLLQQPVVRATFALEGIEYEEGDGVRADRGFGSSGD